MEAESIIQWHPAFCSAMELEFRADKKILEYTREMDLGKMPLRVDFLVIKKKPEETIKNEIGDFFRGSNIMEYKSPDDEMNINTFYKVLSYACLYRSEKENMGDVFDTDITISLIRERKPVKLLKQLGERYSVREKHQGIYRVDGMLFPLQIVVTKRISPETHIWLKALTKSLKRDEAEILLKEAGSLQDQEDKANAGAVLGLASDVNEAVFEEIVKEGGHMTEALKEIVEPELHQLRLLVVRQDAEIARISAEKEQISAEKEQINAEKEQISAEKEQINAEKVQIVLSKDARIAQISEEKEQISAENSLLKQQLEELRRKIKENP